MRDTNRITMIAMYSEHTWREWSLHTVVHASKPVLDKCITHENAEVQTVPGRDRRATHRLQKKHGLEAARLQVDVSHAQDRKPNSSHTSAWHVGRGGIVMRLKCRFPRQGSAYAAWRCEAFDEAALEVSGAVPVRGPRYTNPTVQ